jgi:hypothetical protein
MRNSQAKVMSDNLFDQHTPSEISLALLRIRAYLLTATHPETPGGYLEEMHDLDELFMDLCAFFATMPEGLGQAEDIEEPQTCAQ